ncbi:hypothetical protein BJV82DRAFT_606577 [Fennellomyces sp. T-0311]|nr:hypothetical protein BJV82DRAFT_606577 [Fennellomyces sp. T-0311]
MRFLQGMVSYLLVRGAPLCFCYPFFLALVFTFRICFLIRRVFLQQVTVLLCLTESRKGLPEESIRSTSCVFLSLGISFVDTMVSIGMFFLSISYVSGDKNDGAKDET